MSNPSLPEPPAGLKLFARFGDGDEIVEVGNYISLPDEVNGRNILGPLEPTSYGIPRDCVVPGIIGLTADGYTGWNYISIFYGTDGETPVKGLTQEELDWVNDRIEHEAEEYAEHGGEG